MQPVRLQRAELRQAGGVLERAEAEAEAKVAGDVLVLLAPGREGEALQQRALREDRAYLARPADGLEGGPRSILALATRLRRGRGGPVDLRLHGRPGRPVDVRLRGRPLRRRPACSRPRGRRRLLTPRIAGRALRGWPGLGGFWVNLQAGFPQRGLGARDHGAGGGHLRGPRGRHRRAGGDLVRLVRRGDVVELPRARAAPHGPQPGASARRRAAAPSRSAGSDSAFARPRPSALKAPGSPTPAAWFEPAAGERRAPARPWAEAPTDKRDPLLDLTLLYNIHTLFVRFQPRPPAALTRGDARRVRSSLLRAAARRDCPTRRGVCFVSNLGVRRDFEAACRPTGLQLRRQPDGVNNLKVPSLIKASRYKDSYNQREQSRFSP